MNIFELKYISISNKNISIENVFHLVELFFLLWRVFSQLKTLWWEEPIEDVCHFKFIKICNYGTTAGNFMKNATVKQIADNFIKKKSQPYGKIHFQRNIDSVMLEKGVAKKQIKVCGYIPKILLLVLLFNVQIINTNKCFCFNVKWHMFLLLERILFLKLVFNSTVLQSTNIIKPICW